MKSRDRFSIRSGLQGAIPRPYENYKISGTVIKSGATLNSQAKMWHTFEYRQTFVGVPQ